MPAWYRYGVGDLVSLILYGVVRYRRGVVADNLARSFPEKSTDERKTIERRFYRYLGEVFVETLSLVSMTERQLRRAMTYDNIELID
ncbi:MAG: acetyltransferase, partial [Rikenellaceae bacterium]|nr:acetyltransferase [Rikenellaceae bacterium]